MKKNKKKSFNEWLQERKAKAYEWVREHDSEIKTGGLLILGSAALFFLAWSTSRSNNQYLEGFAIEDSFSGNGDYCDLNTSDAYEAEDILYIPTIPKEVHVREHIRTLPPTWNPSPDKLLFAEKNGVELEEHQTVVFAYTFNKDNSLDGDSYENEIDDSVEQVEHEEVCEEEAGLFV